ncbi:MAG: hypothetical protein BKP49_03250 [Treponema sp. CETP13]|nr:MAG: hypothetical protein BKP49_03250 [Treponema sp. CETP13]
MKKTSIVSRITILFVVFIATFTLAAQETSVENAYNYKLDNGLELFVMENHTVPLTYIEIAVRAGGIGQDVENAGLFHLYEHMMFKGNSQYPTAAAFQKGLKSLGVSGWNGSTSSECVHYFFKIPSDLTEKGLEFWSSAIRNPLLDSKELENEKKVVISEISGGYGDPGTILGNAIAKLLFPKFPWRLDPAGPVKNVENATVKQLREIQQKYYVPNNAALFVGGDVNHEEVYKMVKKIYGDWPKANDPWTKDREYQSETPFKQTKYMVMPYSKLSSDLGEVLVLYRGPDTVTDIESTYAADILGNISANPNGIVKQSIINNSELGVPSPDYVSSINFYTQRESGQISFNAILTSPEQSLAERALYLEQTFQGIVKQIANNPNYFKSEEYKIVKQQLKDSDVYARETSSGFLSGLRASWISASGDYYFNYNDKMNNVTAEDVASYAKKYLEDKPALVVVLVNPDIYEVQKESFKEAGFTTITQENAYWWKDSMYVKKVGINYSEQGANDD